MIFLALTSVAAVVIQNGLFNYVTKKNLKEGSSIMSFNFFIYYIIGIEKSLTVIS